MTHRGRRARGQSTQGGRASSNVAASGTLPAAVFVHDARGVVEHRLYWAGVMTEDEGHYLSAILNSENARARVEHMQSRGEQGDRDTSIN
jgi:hypothetical protein